MSEAHRLLMLSRSACCHCTDCTEHLNDTHLPAFCEGAALPLSPAEQAIVARFENDGCEVCGGIGVMVGRWVPSGAERDAGKTGYPVELPCPSCAVEAPR